MAKCRFLGRSCVEIISLVDHIIIDPHYTIPPEKNISTIFLTHEHEDHADLDKIKEIRTKFSDEEKELVIYSPKIIKDTLNLDIERVKDGKTIELEELIIKPFEVDCYKSEECYAYLIKKGDINLLHTADSAKFSKSLKNIGHQVDYCFISCFKDSYADYLEFLKQLNPLLTFPYHFDPGEEDKAKDFCTFLKENGIESNFIEPGTEFEF